MADPGRRPRCARRALGTFDLLQKSHSILRPIRSWATPDAIPSGTNAAGDLPVLGQESNTDGAPLDQETRDAIYRRAKGTKGDEPFRH